MLLNSKWRTIQYCTSKNNLQRSIIQYYTWSLYNLCNKLKRAVLKSDTTKPTSIEKDNSNPIPEYNEFSIAQAFQEELKLPKPVQQKKVCVTVRVPSYKWPGNDWHAGEQTEGKEEMEAIKIQKRLKGRQKGYNARDYPAGKGRPANLAHWKISRFTKKHEINTHNKMEFISVHIATSNQKTLRLTVKS